MKKRQGVNSTKKKKGKKSRRRKGSRSQGRSPSEGDCGGNLRGEKGEL